MGYLWHFSMICASRYGCNLDMYHTYMTYCICLFLKCQINEWLIDWLNKRTNVCRCVCVCGCVRPGIQSEDQNQFFTFKVRTFWQSEVKISVLALWLCAMSSLCHNMGVGGGMDVILSLYVPGMFRGVWKNVLTLNVLYTDLSSLWMPGRTHYTHVCILCPHFECRAR